MSKKSIIDRIKKIKINKYKTMVLAGLAVLSASTLRDKKPISYELPWQITENFIVINSDTIMAEDFYKKLVYSEVGDSWRYPISDSTSTDLFWRVNYEHTNNTRMKRLSEKELTIAHDTSIISYRKKFVDIDELNKDKNKTLFEEFAAPSFHINWLMNNNNTVQEKDIKDDIPLSPIIKKETEVMYNKSEDVDGIGTIAHYMEHRNKITMNTFKADPSLPQEKRETLQNRLDKYYNQEKIMNNYDHEFWHGRNAEKNINGVGMTAEQMYRRRLHDEVSANIKQFWKMRDKYLQNGNDASYFSYKFTFYDDLVKEGKISPKYGEEISEIEQKYIAEGIRNSWEEHVRKQYKESTLRYVEDRLRVTHNFKTSKADAMYEKLIDDAYTYEHNGQVMKLRKHIKEFDIPADDRIRLEDIKKKRGLNIEDALGYMQDYHGKKGMNKYIEKQREKYVNPPQSHHQIPTKSRNR